MEIRINGQDLSFTLEKEKCLGEVIPQIESWLQDSQMGITALLADEKEIRLNEESAWEKLLIKDIGMLDITAKSMQEIRLERIETLYQYISLLLAAVRAKDVESLRELTAEYPYIRPVLANICNIEHILDESGIMEASVKPDRMNGLIDTLEGTLLVLADRIREITDPMKELASTIQLLEVLLPDMSDVSVLLQTGKDKDAMKLIIQFTELSEKLSRIFSNLKESRNANMEKLLAERKTFQEHTQGLNTILKELTSAFELKDSVLIGDLLEYEIVPRMNSIIETVKHL